MMDGSILVTGASGFLGTRLVAQLARQGHQVVGLSRHKPLRAPAAAGFIEGDLLDPAAVRRALTGCRAILHLAAVTGKHPPAEYFRNNLDGTGALIKEARRSGIEKFIYVSTIAVKFPDIRHYYYAQSKQQAEAAVAASGLCWTIVRPTMIFGDGSPVLAGLRRLATLPILPIFGNGIAQVQPIFVDDLAQALATMVEGAGLAGCTLEMGGPESLSIEQLLLRIRSAAGIRNRRVVHLPVKPMAACLAWVEPALGPWLPVTAGQLASFTYNGTAAANGYTERLEVGLAGIDRMLQSVA
jgi:nucleoside-diphosphate-sugar epimerase